MPTQTMTKFVAGTTLYLKQPTDDQLESVMAWLNEKELIVEACKDGTAIFTPSGRGKSAPMVAIDFKSSVDPQAYAKMAKLYPAPKVLTGIVVTTHEVTDDLATHMNDVAADATAHAMAAIAITAADKAEAEPTPLGNGTSHTAQLESDLVAIGAANTPGPGPAPSPDDVPF